MGPVGQNIPVDIKHLFSYLINQLFRESEMACLLLFYKSVIQEWKWQLITYSQFWTEYLLSKQKYIWFDVINLLFTMMPLPMKLIRVITKLPNADFYFIGRKRGKKGQFVIKDTGTPEQLRTRKKTEKERIWRECSMYSVDWQKYLRNVILSILYNAEIWRNSFLRIWWPSKGI